MKYEITSQDGVRSTFWDAHHEFKHKSGREQNDYPADVRTAFCNYVDVLVRDGIISEDLAQRKKEINITVYSVKCECGTDLTYSVRADDDGDLLIKVDEHACIQEKE